MWIDAFSTSAYAQIAGISLFLGALHVYAWFTRGRSHFLSEFMIYMASFWAFYVAQETIAKQPELMNLHRSFGLLALALWIQVLSIVRSIIRALMKLPSDT